MNEQWKWLFCRDNSLVGYCIYNIPPSSVQDESWSEEARLQEMILQCVPREEYNQLRSKYIRVLTTTSGLENGVSINDEVDMRMTSTSFRWPMNQFPISFLIFFLVRPLRNLVQKEQMDCSYNWIIRRYEEITKSPSWNSLIFSVSSPSLKTN